MVSVKVSTLGQFYVYGITQKPLLFKNRERAIERVQEIIIGLSTWGIEVAKLDVKKFNTNRNRPTVVCEFEYFDARLKEPKRTISVIEV